VHGSGFEVAGSFSAINASRFNATAVRKLNLFRKYRDGKVAISNPPDKKVKIENWNRRTVEVKQGSMHYL